MIKKIGMIVMILFLVGCNSVENVVKIEVQSEEQYKMKALLDKNVVFDSQFS